MGKHRAIATVGTSTLNNRIVPGCVSYHGVLFPPFSPLPMGLSPHGKSNIGRRRRLQPNDRDQYQACCADKVTKRPSRLTLTDRRTGDLPMDQLIHLVGNGLTFLSARVRLRAGPRHTVSEKQPLGAKADFLGDR